ncbi:MAG: cytochrome b/b6 domain-containing protein [Novosphingobium sp.]
MAVRVRHALSTRLWHWLNALCLIVLFMSGLNISNAHPHLYWGEWGFDPRTAWLSLPEFPDWSTIPGYYSLAEARLWHFLAAWPFAIGFALFLAAALLRGHFRDFMLSRRELRWSAIREDFAHHLKLDFTAHDGPFNLLQKYLYILVLFVALPLMILTGLTLSPAMGSNWQWLLDVFGGRQSARSLHFVIAWGLLVFFVLHILAVLLSNPVKQIREMITGGRLGETAA